MKLMTKELKQKFDQVGCQEGKKDPIVIAKFFTPWSFWTWYATEFDGNDTLFGYIVGFEKEWGYFSLSELEEVTGPFGLKVERDLYFKPTPISKILAKEVA